MSAIRNFIFFLINSPKENIHNDGFKAKIIIILKLLLFNNLILLIISLAKILLINYGIINPISNNYTPIQNIYKLFFFTALLGPLIEETAFRLWIKYKISHILLSLIALSYFIFSKFSLLITIGGIVVIISTYFSLKYSNNKVLYFWNIHTRGFVIISAIIFGYMHLNNFVISINLLLFSPLMLSTFIIAGMIFGYLRVRLGFLYGYLAHAIQNILPILLTFFIK